MHKLVSNRFFIIYVLISIIAFLLIFGVFAYAVSNYFTNALIDDIIGEANSLGNAYIDTLIKDPSYDDMNTQSYFRYKFHFLTEQLGTRAILLDTNHNIIIDSEIEHPETLDTILNNDMVEKAMKGQVQIDRGISNGINTLSITVAVPMIRIGKTYGVIMMHAPYPKINNEINFIYQITFFTLIAILIIAFVFTFIYSKRTKHTLDALIKTSKEVASGNFSSRINASYAGEYAKLAKTMNDMAEELGKLEATRKDFIANISHDFRSPLTSIKGFVQAILDGTIPPEHENKYLNIVLDETERLTQLTNNILLLTKMENQQIVLEKSNFDIHSVLRKVLLQFEQQILKKNLNVTVLFDLKELYVYADLNQIQRVLYNIIDNAVKFCREGDEVIVDTEVVKDKAEISISDTGQGIPEEHIKYIWDRFHKADRSRGKDKKGTGIGLSIVKEIIKAHDETIDVFSQEGKGTTFVFTLELSKKQEHRSNKILDLFI